jgi:nitrite reductase/ring-hydroxylating ferredoxin subunit
MSGARWVTVAPIGRLGVGSMLGVEVGDLQIAVYNVEGELFATDNICTHAFALLTDGFLDGAIVECPLHAGCFNVKSGEGMGDPISENIKTYRVRVNADSIEVEVP